MHGSAIEGQNFQRRLKQIVILRELVKQKVAAFSTESYLCDVPMAMGRSKAEHAPVLSLHQGIKKSP